MAILPLLTSCGNSNQTKTATNTIAAKQECFIAIDEKDTAYLDFKISDAENVTGDLRIKYAEKEENIGTIAGKFKGDTLFVDYTFILGNKKSPIYKNPLAFLRKDNQLILGVGVIETTLGRSYFVKDKPITFDKSKFTFEKCKN